MFELEPSRPKDFEKKRAQKVAKIVLLMNQLNDIPYNEGFKLVFRSPLSWDLRNEKTKAWFTPEYWFYYYILKSYDMEPKPAREWYDITDIPQLTEEAQMMINYLNWNK